MPRRMRGRESIHASGFGWVLREAFNCKWNHSTMHAISLRVISSGPGTFRTDEQHEIVPMV